MRPYDDQEVDLVLDEAHWSLVTVEQKICANRILFGPRDPVLLGRVKGTFKPSYRCGFSQQKCTHKNHVDQLRKNMTDDDRALLVLYSSRQESLKASTASALIGKKRKEATATKIRDYQKQFLEARMLSANPGLKMKCYWVTGRWVLTLKQDKDGKFLKTKARWVLRGFQDKQKNDQQTDSPAASRSGFCLAIQAGASKGWNICHMDLKTVIRIVTSFAKSLLKDIPHTLALA